MQQNGSQRGDRKSLWIALPAAAAVIASAFVAGGLGALLATHWSSSSDGDGGFFLSSGLLQEVHADLESGEYSFFPNRRSIWVINNTNGRMANYNFHDDEVGSVDRTRVATLDLKTFPRGDTKVVLSDRNMNNILWVCNAKTGDVQMWTVARDATLRGEHPVATSTDLTIPVRQK